jgi:cell division protein FtsZ
VHDGGMKEEVRVTVIATGFDKAEQAAMQQDNVIRADFQMKRVAEGGGGRSVPVIPTTGFKAASPPATTLRAVPKMPQAPAAGSAPAPATASRPLERRFSSDLEIPTFIRRQMD